MVKERYLAKSDTPVHEVYGRTQTLADELKKDIKQFVKQLAKDMQLDNNSHVKVILTTFECECQVDLSVDKDKLLYMVFYFTVKNNAYWSDALVFSSCYARIETLGNGYVIKRGGNHNIYAPLTYENICNQLVGLPLWFDVENLFYEICY